MSNMKSGWWKRAFALCVLCAAAAIASLFTIVSSTEIATSVPYGATTGTVKAVTPGGTLLSNVPFRVLP